MKKIKVNQRSKESTESKQIDRIMMSTPDWRGKKLSDLRANIKSVHPSIVEEIKWRKPSNPLGIPVWSYMGIICFCNILKNSVRLTFPKGAMIRNPKGFFNARLDSKSVRAIDLHKDEDIELDALKAIILEAMKLNQLKNSKNEGRD